VNDELEQLEQRRIPCEVYSRVVGYLRPVGDWGEAKRLEFSKRHLYDEDVNGRVTRSD